MEPCQSALWVGQNMRVAMWCSTCHEFLGNPASVEQVVQLWNEHEPGGTVDWSG